MIGAAIILRSALWAVTGLALGAAFFTLLRLNVALYGSRHWPTGVAVHLGRWALLATALVFAARAGAVPLLSAALGILIARTLVLLRGSRRVQP